MLDGIINIDKPAGLSSAATLNRIKRLLPRGTKLGHAGTLDPFATGVLVALVGKATKLCERMMDKQKVYLAEVKLGANTDTDDPESEEIPIAVSNPPDEQAVHTALQKMVGQIEQFPPTYSALKTGGQPAYKLARAGIRPPTSARLVRIDSIELLSYQWPMVQVRVTCGRGVYIRSIARDLGEALSTGGYLTTLRRLRVGAFSSDDAVSIDQLFDDGVEKHLHPPVV